VRFGGLILVAAIIPGCAGDVQSRAKDCQAASLAGIVGVCFFCL
jgi:hypothetical protein